MLILLLFIPTAFAFDQDLLNKERELIKNEFLIKQENLSLTNPAPSANNKVEKKLIRKRYDSKIPDLESMYFDTVKTNVAAPKRNIIKRKRSR
jgi:hypothetical protein